MKTRLTVEWLVAALIRALKTVAQTAAGMIAVGATMDGVDWKYVISVALVAGILSILTSVAGLPEVASDGTLQIDPSGETKDVYRFALNSELETLGKKKRLVIKVDPNAKLSE